MMIYLALVDLVDGMCALLGGTHRYEFVGADSSFALPFTRVKSDVALRQGKTDLGLVALALARLDEALATSRC